MPVNNLMLTIILSVIGYLLLTGIVCLIVPNRKDDTPVWEVLLLCIFFSPILALILEMLKPYRPKTETKTITSTADITDEDLQRYLERKNGK